MLLPVSGAFHSSLMAPAAAGMQPLIDRTPICPARVPLVGNVDAHLLTEPEHLRRELVEHICASVRWVDVVGTFVQRDVAAVYEVGPGKVLAGLIGRCAPDLRVITAERLLAEQGS